MSFLVSRKFSLACLSVAAIAGVGRSDEGPKVEYKPLIIGAMSEFGMLQSGKFGSNPDKFKDEWVDHFAAYFIQSAVIEDKWQINVGLGGIFEFQKPEIVQPEWGGTQYKNFFIGPAVADIEYTAGKNWRVGMGSFSYKYNPDANNLGEYLFRTGPYPTYIMTGGYSFVNNTSATLQGLKTLFKAGNLSLDLFLTTETTMPPLYDLSLAGMVKYGIGGGLLDLGLGVNAKRIIPIRPSKTTLKDPANAYFERSGVTYSGDESYYSQRAKFYERKLASNPTDPTWNQLQDLDSTLADSVHIWTNSAADNLAYYTFIPGRLTTAADTAAITAASGVASLQYYTQSGIILDAMFSLDLKKIIPMEFLGPNDLRLYGEVALLGVKNYPVFYEKQSERMPMMVGFNVPGFRFIDLIAVQWEYFGSPHINSFIQSLRTNAATPEIAQGQLDSLFSENDYMDVRDKDNTSWSVLVKKQLFHGLHFSAQVARDHARMVSEKTFAGPMFDGNEVLYTSKDWYWMVQFSFGI